MKRRRLGLAKCFLLLLRPDSGSYHGRDSRFLAGRVTGSEAPVVGEDEEKEEEEGEGDDAVVVVAAVAAAEEEEEGPERRCRCKLGSSRSVLKACLCFAGSYSALSSQRPVLPGRLGPFCWLSPFPPSPVPPSGPGLFRCRSVRGCGSAALRPAREQPLVCFLAHPPWL